MTEKLRPFTNKAPISPLRSSWKPEKLLARGPLTDKQIDRYAKVGWYSAEFKKARLEIMKAKERRDGNFLLQDGRMIFSPK